MTARSKSRTGLRKSSADLRSAEEQQGDDVIVVLPRSKSKTRLGAAAAVTQSVRQLPAAGDLNAMTGGPEVTAPATGLPVTRNRSKSNSRLYRVPTAGEGGRVQNKKYVKIY